MLQHSISCFCLEDLLFCLFYEQIFYAIELHGACFKYVISLGFQVMLYIPYVSDFPHLLSTSDNKYLFSDSLFIKKCLALSEYRQLQIMVSSWCSKNRYKSIILNWKPEIGSKNHSFTVSYLINNLGLSPHVAISNSKRVKFESLINLILL